MASVDINWDLQGGDLTFDLHPGEIPDAMISMMPATPSEHAQADEGMSGDKIHLYMLTCSALQAQSDTYANSVEPDETAHNEPSLLDLHCLAYGWSGGFSLGSPVFAHL